jgi:hypothetical protein
MKSYIIIGISLLMFFGDGISMANENTDNESKTYIGSKACQECHEDEYSNYLKYSKKAKSFESIKKMEKKLAPDEYQSCFECHTTGYGKKGGFVSEEKTPQLSDAGCEVCHGPGSLHAQSEDPDDIVQDINMENCNTCHSKDRINAFDFKPLLFGGAH